MKVNGDTRQTSSSQVCDQPVAKSKGFSSISRSSQITPSHSYHSGEPSSEKLGSIGDRIWVDSNENGLQDRNEVGLAGVEVTLLRADSSGQFQIVATTTTDSAGNYRFDELPAGDNELVFEAPEGYVFSPDDVGHDDTIDSDADNVGRSDVVTLGEGEINLNIDSGLICKPTPPPAKLGSIGDRVWHDTNGNGIQDAGEAGVAGVIVELTGAGDDGKFGTGDDIELTTQTDGAGAYAFDDLKAGDYVATFTAPDGKVFTIPNAGTDPTADSNADPDTGETGVITLEEGEDERTIDAGLVEEPVGPELGSIGDFVFLDDNQNGIQDDGEDGVAGLTVTLRDRGGFVGTTTTDDDGFYLFDGLEAGDYRVNFTAPEGLAFTEPFQGDDPALDSNASPTNGNSDIINLEAGEDDSTIDAGLIDPAAPELGSIGDVVFLDDNQDGIQDPDEDGVEGVTVTLTDDDGNPLETTTTDADGAYLFDELDAGDDQVAFSDLLDGFVFTQPFQGTDPALDSNADPVTGESDVITLERGEDDPTIDAGIFEQPVAQPAIELQKLVRAEKLTPDFDGPVCDVAGKPLGMTFLFTGGSQLSTSQDGDKASVSGNVPTDGTFRVIVSKEDDPDKALDGKAEDTFFDDEVTVGDTFTASSIEGKKLPSNTYIHVFDGNSAIQTSSYHLSCSQPINLGDVIGASTLIGYVGEDASFEIPMVSDDEMSALLAEADGDNAGEETVSFRAKRRWRVHRHRRRRRLWFLGRFTGGCAFCLTDDACGRVNTST